MEKYPHIVWKWDGSAMVPLPKSAAMCRTFFVVDEHYTLEPREERSGQQHEWFFASVNEAFKNLPEDIAHRWPSPTHLRKWALVQAGYRDETTIVLDSKDTALEVAKAARKLDLYAVISVQENIIHICTAHSQAYRAMDKKTFRESADAVLGVLTKLLGI